MKHFLEYAGDENGVISFSPPNARPWHLFLWHTRSLFLDAHLPYGYFGGFSFDKGTPESMDVMRAMEALRWVFHVRHPDWRIVLYPKMYREPISSHFPKDPTLTRSLEIAYAVAIRTDGFLEL
ncbi:MAG: hypothetical protein HZA35_03100 [Parcubacteria group bacterium]|nr:hypothetical protein [Parcubacteria group bacterium]